MVHAFFRNFSILTSIAIFSISGCTSPQATTKSPTDFTEYMAIKFRSELGSEPVGIKGPLTLNVGSLTLNLDRIYSFCTANPTNCEAEASQYAKDAVKFIHQTKAPLDKNAIRLVVRTNMYVNSAQKTLGGGAPKLASWPLSEGLVTLAVLDTPGAIRPLNENDLNKMGLSQSQLLEIGTQNLDKTLEPLSSVAKPVSKGQIGTITGNIYEVGRIAIPSRWSELAKSQGGTLLVAMPTTDKVLYISSSTSDSIDALRTLANSTASHSSNPLSDLILKWSPNGWETVK